MCIIRQSASVTTFMMANREDKGTDMVMPANPPVTLQGHSMSNTELSSLCTELIRGNTYINGKT